MVLFVSLKKFFDTVDGQMFCNNTFVFIVTASWLEDEGAKRRQSSVEGNDVSKITKSNT